MFDRLINEGEKKICINLMTLSQTVKKCAFFYIFRHKSIPAKYAD